MVLQDQCANITDQGQDKILRQVQLHFFLEFENHICLNESSTFHLCGFPCYLKWTMLYAYKMMNVVLLVDVKGKIPPFTILSSVWPTSQLQLWHTTCPVINIHSQSKQQQWVNGPDYGKQRLIKSASPHTGN